MGSKSRSSREIDELVARRAEAQYGLIARRQLVQEGVSRSAIDKRVAAGRLRPASRGVLRVAGVPTTPRAALAEALLLAGDGAVLCRRGAARFWEVEQFGTIDVARAAGGGGSAGVKVRRGRLLASEWIVRDGLAVVTPSRMLLELAAMFERQRFERLFARAEVLQLVDLGAIARTLARRPRGSGSRALRELAGLTSSAVRPRVRSELERRFLRFVVELGLPEPETNAVLEIGEERFEVDCVWREQGLIAEVDGRAFHGDVRSYEEDRRRDRRLGAAHWRVVRVTAEQIEAGEELAGDLRALLGDPSVVRRPDRSGRP